MTEEDIVELELERVGYLAVYHSYTKNNCDVMMNSALAEMLNEMLIKAKECQNKIDDHFNKLQK